MGNQLQLLKNDRLNKFYEGGSEDSDDYANEVKRIKSRKARKGSSKNAPHLESLINTEMDILRQNSSTRGGDESTLIQMRNNCISNKAKFAIKAKKFKADVLQFEKYVKELENDIRQKIIKLRSNNLVDPMQDRRLLNLKNEIEANMKELTVNLKTLTKLIVDIKSYTVNTYGD